ncbi:hypothetical protein BER93_04230 [Xanthomonas fragariae]|nr:hypothetical protein BER92_04230 [Xanthomonas fragariae]AOD17458.1 hypothetical protein BER93_04230 [Xanthomonas fragariae]ENZ94423.1 hypothetical protein O1K_16556 [Xanthomonas fragariae LMG 25863]
MREPDADICRTVVRATEPRRQQAAVGCFQQRGDMRLRRRVGRPEDKGRGNRRFRVGDDSGKARNQAARQVWRIQRGPVLCGF